MRVALAAGFLLLLLGTAGYLSWRLWLRNREVAEIEAVQQAGGVVPVTVVHTRRLYFGSGHFGFGGGDRRVNLRFQHAGEVIRWHGGRDREPRALQLHEGTPYLAVQDEPRSLSARDRFFFYRYIDGSWEQVAPEAFPPSSAICNLSPYGAKYREAMERDPSQTEVLRDQDEQYAQQRLDEIFGRD